MPSGSFGPIASAAAQETCHNVRVVADATSAAQPTRNADQASSTRSVDQPGNAFQLAGAYFAGSEGAGGVTATGGGATGGVGACSVGAGGVTAQPVTIASAATLKARHAGSERRGCSEMEWFLLETMVALLIAVGIVAWTMGPKRRKRSAGTPSDAENGSSR